MNPAPPLYTSSLLDLNGAAQRMGQALAEAEELVSKFTRGEADAIIDPTGQAYLLSGAQRQLRRSEAALKELFDNVPDVIWVLDGQGEILSVNATVTKLAGHDPQALIGRSFMAFCHPDDRGAIHQAFSEVAATGMSNGVAKFRHRAKAGTWLALEATVSGLPPTQDGRFVVSGRPSPIAKVGIVHAALGAGSSLLGPRIERTLAVISHELRTPLTPVLLTLHDLATDESLAHLRPAFNMMEGSLRQQVRLIEDLRGFAQVAHQKLGLSLEPLDAHTEIECAMDVCARALEERDLIVDLHLRAATSTVLADSLRFQQIIWNIVQNAIKFSSPGGSILVSSSNPRTDSFLLEISDQGKGIDAAFLPLVFEPFQQGSSNRCGGGSLGLGMYIARGLAEAQNGTLTAASEGLGRGSAFQLTLPTACDPPCSTVIPSEFEKASADKML